MLGFVKTGPLAARDRKSEYLGYIEDGTHNLYVYCDLIELVAVGNANVSLLRIVQIQKGPIITTSYSEVLQGDISEIVPFVDRKSFVTLHFHQK